MQLMDQYSLMDGEDHIKIQSAWEHVLRRLAIDVPPAWFERFIRPLKPLKFEEGIIVFGVPGRFVQEWVRDRYLSTLTTMLSDELGEHIKVELQAYPQEKEDVPIPAPVSVPLPEAPTFKGSEKFTFENFVVGQSNRLAFAGAKAVASDPGVRYNPLFIYGSSGLGKTHLLHAISREISSKHPSFSLVYISAQQFAEDFVHALQNGRIESFRKNQRNVGVWLVDDIQFVMGRDKTQEEVFHTFNYLHSLGKQIVLTADRPPRDLFMMDERLRSRFESGLVADIQLPDTETRSAIVLSKAKADNITIDTSVAMYLAEHVPGNIRVLEGALTRLLAQASLTGETISAELAANVIDQNYKSGVPHKPRFPEILGTVSKHYRISEDEIKGIRRNAPICHARHVAIFLTRELTGDSLKHIGTLFGDRDHTSMMHGYQKISEMMHQDKEFKATMKALMRELHPDQ